MAARAFGAAAALALSQVRQSAGVVRERPDPELGRVARPVSLLRRVHLRDVSDHRARVACWWLLAVHHFGATFNALRVAVFGTVLLGVAITDAKHYLIPDGFTVFGLDVRAADIRRRVLRDETQVFATPYDALVGACAGAGLIAIVGWLGEVVTKREAMGLGDVTLMAFVGAALGPTRALMTVLAIRTRSQ